MDYLTKGRKYLIFAGMKKFDYLVGKYDIFYAFVFSFYFSFFFNKKKCMLIFMRSDDLLIHKMQLTQLSLVRIYFEDPLRWYLGGLFLTL